jgi:hypothetical protein
MQPDEMRVMGIWLVATLNHHAGSSVDGLNPVEFREPGVDLLLEDGCGDRNDFPNHLVLNAVVLMD